jgi:hypothetical protein
MSDKQDKQDRSDLYGSYIPNERDRHTLAGLKADTSHSRLSEKMQNGIIRIMREDPTGSYAFLAPSGYSKSTFIYALLHEAFIRHPLHLFTYSRRQLNGYVPVVYTQSWDLLNQIENHKYHEGEPPIITVRKIERMVRNGVFFTLAIDEFEKTRNTKFGMNEFYAIIDACYKARGKCQFLIAGNLTKEDLKDKSQFSEGMYRRIEELCETKDGKSHFWELENK